MKKIEIKASKTDKILNIISTEISGLSYSLANKILRKKDIRINDKKIFENISVDIGDKITIFVPDNLDEILTREKNFFDIVYEDDNILLINKFKGIEVCSLTEKLTIESLLNKKYSKIYPLNRLDRNTEGLVIFAKSKNIFEKLKQEMKNNAIEKFYLAEVIGNPKWDNYVATAYLLKDDEKSEVKISDKPIKNSKKIITEFFVSSRSSGGTSVLIIKIKNGKTHQIRAHLAHIGFPIIGDGKYGKYNENKKFKSKTQKLTAYKLIFNFKDASLKYLNEKSLEISPSWITNK